MIERGAEVVCDAGPLIHLDELGCLELLSGFSAVLVPEEVQHEVDRHRPTALDQRGVEIQFQAVQLSTAPSFRALVQTLGLALGIRVQGTVGVLVRAVRWKQRTRDEVLEVLRRIPKDSTLHIRPSLLDEVIHQVESS